MNRKSKSFRSSRVRGGLIGAWCGDRPPQNFGFCVHCSTAEVDSLAVMCCDCRTYSGEFKKRVAIDLGEMLLGRRTTSPELTRL